jgi:hypothetical protein
MDTPTRPRLVTDPAVAGAVKLRIRSDGTCNGSYVVAIDHEGIERRVELVTAVSWSIRAGEELAEASLTVAGVEVDLEADLDAPASTPKPEGGA